MYPQHFLAHKSPSQGLHSREAGLQQLVLVTSSNYYLQFLDTITGVLYPFSLSIFKTPFSDTGKPGSYDSWYIHLFAQSYNTYQVIGICQTWLCEKETHKIKFNNLFKVLSSSLWGHIVQIMCSNDLGLFSTPPNSVVVMLLFTVILNMVQFIVSVYIPF